MILLDTTVIIDILRGSPAALRFVRALTEAPACSQVTRAEVVRGLRSEERRSAARLFDAIEWFPVDEAVATRAGELGRRYRRSHAMLDVADLLIAATALEHGAGLATANVRHFPMFKGLRAPYRSLRDESGIAETTVASARARRYP